MVDLRIVYAVLLTILPVSELRAGMPLAIIYASDSNLPLFWVFLLIVLCNITAILIAFYFLDRIHERLLKFRHYRNIFGFYIRRMQKKVDRFEKRYSMAGFAALALFVAIPFPATGAWSGALISWLLDLDRKKSILAIAAGVLIAGILVLLGTLGFLTLFY